MSRNGRHDHRGLALIRAADFALSYTFPNQVDYQNQRKTDRESTKDNKDKKAKKNRQGRGLGGGGMTDAEIWFGGGKG